MSRGAAASWGAVIVLFAILSLVGLFVRRRVPGPLRGRSRVLLAASVTIAAVTALWAALLRYNTPAKGPPGGGSGYYTAATHHYHGAASYFLAALVMTLLLGVFAFDVVGLLREPLATALHRAGALVGIAFLAFGLLFPVFVISDRLPTANSSEDFGRAAGYSAAVGGFAIPLALQAPVSVSQWMSSPWINPRGTSDRTSAHWQDLAIATAIDHPQGRLFQYAASLGVWGSLVGALISAIILAAIAWMTIELCRRLRLVRRGACLRLGVLQGACVALLVTVATVVTALSCRIAWNSGLRSASSQPPDLWRTTPLGLAYSAAILIGFCAAVGLLYSLAEDRRAGRSAREACTDETANPAQPG
jgi:hypothetical protein